MYSYLTTETCNKFSKQVKIINTHDKYRKSIQAQSIHTFVLNTKAHMHKNTSLVQSLFNIT